MKHFFYTFFLFFFPACLVAQTYHPFPDSSAIWRIETTVSSDPDPTFVFHHSVFISGDTLINGNTYHNLYKSNITASDTLASNYVGAIREVNKKVHLHLDSLAAYNIANTFFFCNGPDTSVLNKDLLLYDFNVTIGDTILYDYLDSIKIEITSIDSILIQNQYRKRYHYNFIWTGNYPYCNGLLWSYNYYIESIGSPLGVFGHLGTYFENHSELLCFEDTEVAYPDSLACYNAVGINDATIKENSVAVYPNPNNGVFTLDLPQKEQSNEIYIYNISGKLVQQINISNNSVIDISKQPNGIYFVKVIHQHQVITQKIVKY